MPAVARLLKQGCVVAWAQGRCEIGPRALGNRSLLAAPFDVAMRDRLNGIKEREEFRPIAPICLEEDVSRHFEWTGPSPYMLFFQNVTDQRLRAVTHIDGTARVQTVNRSQNAAMTDLLLAFRAETGVGVLCNTSLNLRGSGFISRTSDLYNFCKARKIEAFAYGEQLCIFQQKSAD
jgi:hydroxymethyl cephem carbamoyltransferase